jgi:lipoprotein-anchoring transpeptidase ErfK/SrfK
VSLLGGLPERNLTPAFEIARVKPGRTVVLREQPGGNALAYVAARTEFGSPQTLAVVQRYGRWLGVTTAALGNGRIVWIDAAERSVSLAHADATLEVDLSRRELGVRRGRQLLRRFVVDIGARSSPTPIGRFSITDKLSGTSFGTGYGCCILALSGRQPQLPAGWRGGDRLAIHGTPGPVTGRAASGGCLRAAPAALRFLMRTVPLGTPVVIHP